MIITISGLPGSGKSTIATRLAKKLGWQQYYMGRLWRELARERKMTLPELQAQAEKDPSIDKMVDEKVRQLGKSDKIIIESRTAYHFIPDSFKIFLKVSADEGARRIFKDIQQSNKRNEGEDLNTVEDVKHSNEQRMASDNRRYQKYYGIDVFDEKRFDFVLDTTKLDPDQVFALTYKEVNKRNS
ncbi:MAG: cytidylate kinase family protein [Patescibacteria group bacterium]